MFFYILNNTKTRRLKAIVMTKIINLHDDFPIELFADRFYGTGNFEKRFDWLEESFEKTIGAIYLPTKYRTIPRFQQRAFEYARLVLKGNDFLSKGDRKYFLSFEGLDSFENIDEAEKYIAKADFFSLTWIRENNFAYGVGEKGNFVDGGLKEDGRKIAEIMKNEDRHIDVSHLCDNGVLDLTKMKCPIFASHSNSREVFYSKRNLTPCQIEYIANCGGIIGINGYKGFVGKKNHLKKLSAHIKSVINFGGEDCVSLGLDVCGNLLGDNSDCDVLKNIADLTNFSEYLLSLGFTSSLIDKIFFKNAERFLLNEPMSSNKKNGIAVS